MTWSAFFWWLPSHDPLFVSWQRQRQRAVTSLSMILRRSWMKLFLNFLEHSIRFWSLEVDDFESVSIDCHLRKPLQKSRCAFFERVLRQTKGTSSAPNSFIHRNWEQMMLALNNNHIAFQLLWRTTLLRMHLLSKHLLTQRWGTAVLNNWMTGTK